MGNIYVCLRPHRRARRPPGAGADARSPFEPRGAYPCSSTSIALLHRRCSRTDAVASRTVSLRNASLSSTGTATRIRPFRTTRTSRGAGSISTRPSRKTIRSGIPGSRFAWSRISLGRTKRPAESMVDIAPSFMGEIIPLDHSSVTDATIDTSRRRARETAPRYLSDVTALQRGD